MAKSEQQSLVPIMDEGGVDSNTAASLSHATTQGQSTLSSSAPKGVSAMVGLGGLSTKGVSAMVALDGLATNIPDSVKKEMEATKTTMIHVLFVLDAFDLSIKSQVCLRIAEGQA